MDPQQAFEIAKSAVEALVEDRGNDATFPFDVIWTYAPEDVPSTNKPATSNKLLSAGYLEKTGRVAQAESGPRAGSNTPEYRPGPHFSKASKGATGSTVELLQALQKSFGAEGFIVSAEQLANFYLALKTSPLTILAGRSGTGKSLLPRLFAARVGAGFVQVPVQPQWSDNSDLLGYTPTLQADSFVPGRLTEALEQATDDPEELHLAALDEMNLAHVEHYFSDFLSVVESRRREGGAFKTDPLPLDLPSPAASPDPYASLRELEVPPNLKIVGTANMDETTRPFSARVLDRAFTIEFEQADLAAFAEPAAAGSPPDLSPLAERILDSANPISVGEGLAARRELFEFAAGLLSELNGILEGGDVGFAYRTRDAVCLYLWHWAEDEVEEILPLDVAIDLCILQKVLPRVRGHGGALHPVMSELIAWLEADAGTESELSKRPYPRSADKAKAMLARLEQDGATGFWG